MSSTPSRVGGRFFYFGMQPAGDFCVWGGGGEKPSPMRGRWHGGAVTDEVGALAFTQLRPPHQSPAATASPHRGSHGARSQSLPFQGRWLGEAETERLQQSCDNLSVCFADSSPARGASQYAKTPARQRRSGRGLFWIIPAWLPRAHIRAGCRRGGGGQSSGRSR